MLQWERPTCRVVYMKIQELQGMEPRRPAPKPWHSTISDLIPPDLSTREMAPELAESAVEVRRLLASLQNSVAKCLGLPTPQLSGDDKNHQEHKRKMDQVTKHVTKTRSVEDFAFSGFLQAKDQLLKAVSPKASVYDK